MRNKDLQDKLLAWFADFGRDLPWRRTYLPYHIWISEIMLQQTQMDRVVEYFNRWIARFPDIKSITFASEDEILKLWEGLGYYSRVKNIAKTAKILVSDHSGRLPGDHSTLLKFPGIGPYTAGAIMSLAFNREYPIVDGNVERVFARMFDIDKPVKQKESHSLIWQKAEELIPQGNAREFNQSLMELGALICSPKQPQCAICPVNKLCLGRKRGVLSERPVAGESKKVIPLTMVAGFLILGGKLCIRKRPEGKVWGGLWELPGGRLEKNEAQKKGLVRRFHEKTGLVIEVGDKIGKVQHSYTVHKVTLNGYICKLSMNDPINESSENLEYRWIEMKDLDQYAFSSGHRKLIDIFLG